MKYYVQAKLDSARLFAEEEDVPEQRKALLARLQVCGKLWTQNSNSNLHLFKESFHDLVVYLVSWLRRAISGMLMNFQN